MVSELLHNDHVNPYWALWQISLGSMACMCCVVFMGLKLKWFRAQLRLADSPKNNVTPVAVQGVGFRFKSNPDDFQMYNVTSEFAPKTNQNKQNGAQNKNSNYTSMTPVTPKPKSNSNKPTTMTQNTSKPASQSTTSNKSTNLTAVQPKSSSKTSSSNTSSNTTNNKTDIQKQQPNSSAVDSKINIPNKQSPVKENKQTVKAEIKPILKKQDDIQTKNSTVNFEEGHIEISSPTPQKYSDLINKPLNQNKLTSDDDDDEESSRKQEQVANQQANAAKQPMMQIKNPLATRNIVMPMENEDDWKIKIVDEKPKQQKEKREEENTNESYFAPNNSSLYSSQAASIFFGGSAPVAQPRSRKFEEMDEDVMSTGSQTSA